ncbi:hypothetical protein Gotri_013803 [Gossypium trilobum]|uniref:GATA-type domain-containing protein n=1 Tax=Gossypium trilobum TaxID=34281 RepID=A0A7J9DUP5_9ROSI|nr:hypothetical protein [Gossypium trilobum]
MTVPAKARSKRSRAAPCNWASRLLVLSPTVSSPEPDIIVPVQPLPSNQPGKKPVKTTSSSSKKKDGGETSSDGRKCLHCATDKTPQWRTGPMGPKTLCNACGVRYKSGRLKEMVRAQQHHQQQFMHHHHHHQNMIFDVSNVDDYLIHQPVGPDFRQLI